MMKWAELIILTYIIILLTDVTHCRVNWGMSLPIWQVLFISGSNRRKRLRGAGGTVSLHSAPLAPDRCPYRCFRTVGHRHQEIEIFSCGYTPHVHFWCWPTSFITRCPPNRSDLRWRNVQVFVPKHTILTSITKLVYIIFIGALVQTKAEGFWSWNIPA
jgi:hypothetical protein